MNLENKKLIIFDFDGVLVNTLNLCFDIHKKVNVDLTWEKFQDFSNGNFIETIRNAEKEKKHIIPDDFYGQYKSKLGTFSINDILKSTIKLLSEKYIITIVSASFSYIIEDFMKKEKIENYFSDILGSNINKSKVIKINSLLEKYKINPKDTVFITDTLGDILSGNECKVNSIGVTWGLHGRKTLEKGHPIVIIDDPRDLLNSIKNVVK